VGGIFWGKFAGGISFPPGISTFYFTNSGIFKAGGKIPLFYSTLHSETFKIDLVEILVEF